MLTLLSFFTYSFLGWLCECIYCGIPAKAFINRGFLAGPYCPIYGFGALCILFLLQPFSNALILVFLLGVIITSALEYITSYIMELCFHTTWWDYSTYPFNLHGRICLKNSLLFGSMVVFVFYIVNPFILHILRDIPPILQYIITCVLLILFLYDVFHTTTSIIAQNKQFKELEITLLRLVDELHTNTTSLQDSLREHMNHPLNNGALNAHLQRQLNRFQEQMHSLRLHRQKTQERLRLAFPHKIEKLYKKDFSSILFIIEEWKNKQ